MRRSTTALTCMLALVALHPTGARASSLQQAPITSTLVVDAQHGGDIQTVETDGQRIAVGVGPRLVLLDGTTDGDPPPLAASAPLPGNVTAIAFSDRVVVAAYGRRYVGDPQGLALVDRDATGEAEIVGSLELEALPVGMWERDHVVYVAAQVQRPVAPVRSTPSPGRFGTEISDALPSGTTEFSSGVLLTVDIRNPEQPRLLGRQPIDEVPVAYEVSGDRAVLLAAGLPEGRRRPPVLTVMEVTGGAPPRPIGSLTLGGTLLRGGDRMVGGLALGEDHVYVGIGGVSPGLVVVDIHDPAAMVERSHVQTTGHVVALVGQHLYVSDIMGTLVLDVSDPAKPESLGHFSGAIHDVALDADRLVVVENAFEPGLPAIGNRAGVGVLETREDPHRPRRIGRWTSLVDVTSVGATEEHVHATVGSNLLVTMHTRDEAPPRHLDSVAWEEAGWSLSPTESDAGDGYLAMVETGSSPARLFVAAFEPSGAPRPVSTLDLDAMVTGIATHGPWLALTTVPRMQLGGRSSVGPEETFLRLFDLRDPTRPALAGSLHLEARPTALALRDGVAYVTAGEELLVVDVSVPATADVVRRVPGVEVLRGYGRRMDLRDRTLAIATTSGLRIFDLSEPAAPVEVGSVPVDGIDEIALGQDWLYALFDEDVREGKVLAYPLSSLGTRPPARLELPSKAQTMAVQGDRLVVVTEASGLYWLKAEGGIGGGGDGRRGIERHGAFRLWLPALAKGLGE